MIYICFRAELNIALSTKNRKRFLLKIYTKFGASERVEKERIDRNGCRLYDNIELFLSRVNT